ncbi:MAG: peptidoglycan-binding protein [Arenibacterium sp.]
MHKLKFRIFALVLFLWPAFATAQGVDTGLFQGAQAIYGQAQTQTGPEQVASYRNTRLLLDMIVTQFPGSPLAGQIQRREVIEGLDVAALNAALGIPEPVPVPIPVPTAPVAPAVPATPAGAFAAYIGRWNDGGRYCAEISESNQPGLALLRLWACQGDIANSAVAPLVAAPDGLRGAAHQVSVRALNPNELSIDLAAPLYDPFQNPIGPNGPTFSPRFLKEAPVLPSFLNVEPPATEATESALELGRSERREIQRRLTLLGFGTRGVDGVFGPGSRNAIGDWQSSKSLPATSYLSETQIATLREESEELYQEWRRNNRSSSGSGLPAGWWRNSQGQYCRKALLGSTWCQPVRP